MTVTPFGYNTQGPRGAATFGNATTWDAAAIKDGFTALLGLGRDPAAEIAR